MRRPGATTVLGSSPFGVIFGADVSKLPSTPITADTMGIEVDITPALTTAGRPLLKVSEVAEILCVHPDTVRGMIHSGRIRGVQYGGRRGWLRVPREEVERLLSAGVE